MIEKHTFKALIETVVLMEKGIKDLERALRCQFDQNWVTEAPDNIIRAITEGFFDSPIKDRTLEYQQSETIEELLYHFIYMEDCGNDSKHCREKLVRVSNANGEEKAIPCTCIEELYGVIRTYLERTDIHFSFNYCHSHSMDDKELK